MTKLGEVCYEGPLVECPNDKYEGPQESEKSSSTRREERKPPTRR